MTVNTERRDIPRKRPVSLVYVELPPSNGGMIRDLSEVGFAVRAMLPLQPSEKTRFSISLDDATRIDGEAIVLWVEEGGRVAGLEFAGLAVHARESIHKWLAASQVDSVVSPPAVTENSEQAATFDELRTELRQAKPRPIPETKPEPGSHSPETQPVLEGRKSAFTLSPAAMALPSPKVDASSKHEDAVESNGNGGQPRPLSPVELALPAFAPLVDAEPAPAPEPLPPAPPRPRRKASTVTSLYLDGTPPAKASLPPLPSVAPLEPLSSFEGESGSSTPGWVERFTLSRAITIMLWLVVIVGSVVYHRELGLGLIWLGHQLSGQESQQVVPEAPPAAEGSPSPDTSSQFPAPPEAAIPKGLVGTPPESQQSAATPAPETAAPTPAPNGGKGTPPATKSSEPSSAALPKASENPPNPQTKASGSSSLMPLKKSDRARTPVPPTELADSGQSEFQQAQEILRDPNRAAETTLAVRLLWNAVEKGNVNAELALANLYRTGHGVARSCTQARILLSTAARKGSIEAQKRLDELLKETCEE